MYNQFVDEEGQERQIQYLVELGFPERKARIGVQRFGYTISLEDLINRLLDMSDDSSKKSNNNNKISLIQFSDSSGGEMENYSQQKQQQNQCHSQKSLQFQQQFQNPLQQQNQKVQLMQQPIQQNQNVQFQQIQQSEQQMQQQFFYQNIENQNPFDHPEFETCKVCYIQPIQWVHFECKHQFCQPCVIKFIKAKRIRRIEQLVCLEEGCFQKISKEDYHLVSNELLPQMDIQPYNEPICAKCKLPQAAHKFKLFSDACDNAEFQILSACIKQDEEGNILQRCPQCGIWVQKSKGCNSVLCSYCKYNWCWLCRRQCDNNHYVLFNPSGCPGLGGEEFTIDQWPWHKICWVRVKIVLVYFLLIILCIIVYPFFVAQVVIRRMDLSLQGGICYKIFISIFIFLLFLILSIFAIFPGIFIFIVSKRARLYVFAR